MPHKLCRLCLSSDRLIYMFDSRLRTQDQLRACILLSTGVEILSTDIVSKFVCQNCFTIAIKLFKFRMNAIANDKALKEYQNQPYRNPPNEKDMISLHKSLLDSILKTANFKSTCETTEHSDIIPISFTKEALPNLLENHNANPKNSRKRNRTPSESPDDVLSKRIIVCTKENGSYQNESPTNEGINSSFNLLTSKKNQSPIQKFKKGEKEDNGKNSASEARKMIACKLCDKTYSGKPQLKLHEKIKHMNCLVCLRNHNNQTIYFRSLKKPCYKNICNNQPSLCLVRIELVPEIVQNFKDTFEYIFKHKNEGDDVIVVEECNDLSDFEYSITPIEKQNLLKIFENNKTQLQTQDKLTQTDNIDTDLVHSSDDQIAMSNLYKELSIYKISVEFEVAQNWSAQISYDIKHNLKAQSHNNWNSSPVRDLIHRRPIIKQTENAHLYKFGFKAATSKQVSTTNLQYNKVKSKGSDVNILSMIILPPQTNNFSNNTIKVQPTVDVKHPQWPHSQIIQAPSIIRTTQMNPSTYTKGYLRIKSPLELNEINQ